MANDIEILIVDGLRGAAAVYSDDTPQPLGTADAGTQDEAARSDHVHAHGNQAGGTLHATAVASGAAGFISGANQAKLDAITGTNTGDQTVTLTGDVTGSGTGSFATTVAADSVTNSKLANMAAHTIKGNNTAGSADPIDLTLAQVKTELDLSGTNTGDQTNITGNAATVTTNANLTGPVTSVGNATTIADPELAALAGLTSAADTVPFFTGSGTAALASLTSAGRALIDDADASAQRTTLGLGTLATQSGTFSGTSSGTNTGDQTNITGNAATVTTNANLTGPITSVGNATTVADPELAALAGLTSAADKLPYFTGSGTAALADFSAAGRALVDDADAPAQRTTLGLGTLATQSGTFSGTSSGTNTGDQTITLTGDVTGSGTGSFAATVAANAVTNAKAAQMAAHTIKGNNTGSTANAIDLTLAQVLTELGAIVGPASSTDTALVVFSGTTGKLAINSIPTVGASTGTITTTGGLVASGGTLASAGTGVAGTGGATSGKGVTGAGTGSGTGVQGTGGATGVGIAGIGGATSGTGVTGTGTGSSADGVSGTGGATSGRGVVGTGGGSGVGIRGTGGATGAGVQGTGGATSGNGGTFSAAAGNSVGVAATGNGSGAGITAQGGSSSGTGITATAGAGNGRGIDATGTGSGSAVKGTAGATGSGGDFTSTGGDAVSAFATTDGNGVSATAGSNTGHGGLFSSQAGGTYAGVRAIAGTNGPGVSALGNGTGAGVTTTGGSTGNGLTAQGGASGNGIVATGGASAGNGITATAQVSTGFGVAAVNGSGFALKITGDLTSPAFAAVRWEVQDTEPTGAHQVGDMYMATGGVLKVCTVAGTPGTFTSVGLAI